MTLEGILQADEQFTVWKECGECRKERGIKLVQQTED